MKLLVVCDTRNQRVCSIRKFLYEDCVISGSWDGTISLWNANETSLSSPLQSISIRSVISPTSKVYSLDVGDQLLFDYLLILVLWLLLPTHFK